MRIYVCALCTPYIHPIYIHTPYSLFVCMYIHTPHRSVYVHTHSPYTYTHFTPTIHPMHIHTLHILHTTSTRREVKRQQGVRIYACHVLYIHPHPSHFFFLKIVSSVARAIVSYFLQKVSWSICRALLSVCKAL